MSDPLMTPRELRHFLLLSHDEQLAAIRRLAALGWPGYTIAAATRLSVEQIRALRTIPEQCAARASVARGDVNCHSLKSAGLA